MPVKWLKAQKQRGETVRTFSPWHSKTSQGVTSSWSNSASTPCRTCYGSIWGSTPFSENDIKKAPPGNFSPSSLLYKPFICCTLTKPYTTFTSVGLAGINVLRLTWYHLCIFRMTHQIVNRCNAFSFQEQIRIARGTAFRIFSKCQVKQCLIL